MQPRFSSTFSFTNSLKKSLLINVRDSTVNQAAKTCICVLPNAQYIIQF